MNYLLVLPTFPYSGTFIDLRKGVAERLKKEGHTVEFADKVDPDRPVGEQVFFGANACNASDWQFGVVVYQSEALNSPWLKSQTYINRLAQASEIWDYREVTPLCWEEERSDAAVVPGRVVLAGCLSPRRMKACIEISAVPVYGIYGDACNRILDSAELEIELLYDETWDKDPLRLARATSRGRLLLTECHPDPAYALNPKHIKTQVQMILQFTDKAKQEWLQNQRETVEQWKQ